jgi:hypothetical protein
VLEAGLERREGIDGRGPRSRQQEQESYGDRPHVAYLTQATRMQII